MILNSPTISGSLTVTGNIIASGSITLSGSVASASYAASASNALAAQTASYVLTAQTASFVALAQSASNAVSAATASSADNLLVRNTLTAQTLVVQTITSSVDFVTGSTRFGSILDNTHVFTGSVSMTGSLAVVTNGTEFQVTSTGVKMGNVSTDIHLITGSVITSGSIGIGTTPAHSLTLVGGQTTPGSFSGGNYTFGIYSGSVSTVLRETFAIGSDSSYVYMQSFSSRPLYINSAGNNIILGSVAGANSVGIGTTSISGIFQVGVANSGIYFDVSTQYTPKIIAAGTISDIQIQSVGNGGNIYLNAPGTTSLINFQVNGAIRMTVNASGNVSIGITTNPWATLFTVLDINTALSVASYAANYGGLYGNIYYASGTYYFRNTGYGTTINLSTNNGAINMATWGTGAANSVANPVERFNLSSTGTITLSGPTLTTGTQSTYTLLVGEVGSINLTLSHKASTGGYIQTWQSTNLYLNQQGNAVYAGAVRLDTLSDQRIKDNIQPISGSLNKILQLHGKKFHLKDEPENKIRYGFIAQDLEGILDEFVIQTDMTFTKDDLVVENVKSIENWASSWAALLVEAIKELKTQNDALQSRIETLESK